MSALYLLLMSSIHVIVRPLHRKRNIAETFRLSLRWNQNFTIENELRFKLVPSMAFLPSEDSNV